MNDRTFAKYGNQPRESDARAVAAVRLSARTLDLSPRAPLMEMTPYLITAIHVPVIITLLRG